MPIVYMSQDDGTLYDDVDEPELFLKYEVPETITLTPQQICGGYGSIVEILSRAGQITKVE